MILATWTMAQMGTPVALAASPHAPQRTARPTVQPLPTVVVLTPGATSTAAPSSQKPPAPEGAHIVLGLPKDGQLVGKRAVVQWLGKDGRWYDVDGWQSGLTEQDTHIVWWVAPRDFGTGPFRWAVFAAGTNTPVWVSAAFQLPSFNGTIVSVMFAA